MSGSDPGIAGGTSDTARLVSATGPWEGVVGGEASVDDCSSWGKRASALPLECAPVPTVREKIAPVSGSTNTQLSTSLCGI